MKQCHATSDVCERHAPPRSWGGFGKSAPLLTSTSVRLSVQFLHGNTPSAALAVYACIVRRGNMQHPFLLGRESWMCFEQPTYTSLPRHPSRPVFGEFSLATHYTNGLPTFIHDNRPTADVFHLEFAGDHAISFIYAVPRPGQLGSSDVPTFTGQYLVDILPRAGLFSEAEIFVIDGRQSIRSRALLILDQVIFLGLLLLPSSRFRPPRSTILLRYSCRPLTPPTSAPCTITSPWPTTESRLPIPSPSRQHPSQSSCHA